jgi:cob(I)alamin adenosyltransferase
MNKIYTKKGDKGKTKLIGSPDECNKAIPRVEAYGTLDELVSFIGLLHDNVEDQATKDQLVTIIKNLFVLEAHVALDPKASSIPPLPRLDQAMVDELENWIDTMQAMLPPLTHFILPIGHTTVSLAHVCRTITRRAERRIVSVHEKEPLHEIILIYMNRLSDYFFVLARYLAKTGQFPETPWIPQL